MKPEKRKALLKNKKLSRQENKIKVLKKIRRYKELT